MRDREGERESERESDREKERKTDRETKRTNEDDREADATNTHQNTQYIALGPHLPERFLPHIYMKGIPIEKNGTIGLERGSEALNFVPARSNDHLKRCPLKRVTV